MCKNISRAWPCVIAILTLSVASSVFFSCARSTGYKQEQEYYKTDTSLTQQSEEEKPDPNKPLQPRKKIFVLPFLNDTTLGGDDIGYTAAASILRQLQLAKKLSVPTDIRVATTSKDYYQGGKVKLRALIEEGKRLGVAMMVVGKIRKIIFRKKKGGTGFLSTRTALALVDMELRLFDVSQGKEILFDEKFAEAEANSYELFEDKSQTAIERKVELVKQAISNTSKSFGLDVLRAVDKVSWQGRVAKISKNRIYVNAGRASGLNIGDILKALTPGEDIYDPVSGTYLGRNPGQPKGTLEIIDFLGPDVSITRLHTGGGIAENDIVQLY